MVTGGPRAFNSCTGGRGAAPEASFPPAGRYAEDAAGKPDLLHFCLPRPWKGRRALVVREDGSPRCSRSTTHRQPLAQPRPPFRPPAPQTPRQPPRLSWRARGQVRRPTYSTPPPSDLLLMAPLDSRPEAPAWESASERPPNPAAPTPPHPDPASSRIFLLLELGSGGGGSGSSRRLRPAPRGRGGSGGDPRQLHGAAPISRHLLLTGPSTARGLGAGVPGQLLPHLT
ncbi:uncharacterized protein LOC144325976 [Podarcis muralis]